MKSDYAICDLQGFFDNNNQFVLKEFCICDLDGTVSYHCLFQPPYPWDSLSHKVQNTNKYCSRNLHGLNWESGVLNYDDLTKTLRSATSKYKMIFVKGLDKKKFLDDKIDCYILDLGDCFVTQSLKSMVQPSSSPNVILCSYNHNNTVVKNNCALLNCKKLVAHWSNL